ncbi:hypothetical protein BECAL_02969 [Bellilinea caldifistulae]|uniref:Uncharacterized protein n=1 Tax=Bellilinea caldifistulae TaxID=360411 RepID=A0A0P6X3Z5_9CHLR|nr:hypothetical protein [Bellilinea caldifistulae]KPL74564.1 hypothetical protein AC812_12270 [Bellilinea caldifistulae]GAP11776.1 hypothetical protein BECAL_02969 [Bellilinea caldifistulae]
MTDKPKIQFLSIVRTPNGPGLVQGRLVEKDGLPGRILVSHDPHDPQLPEEMRALSHGGIWVLWAYEPEQIEVVTAGRPPRPAGQQGAGRKPAPNHKNRKEQNK